MCVNNRRLVSHGGYMLIVLSTQRHWTDHILLAIIVTSKSSRWLLCLNLVDRRRINHSNSCHWFVVRLLWIVWMSHIGPRVTMPIDCVVRWSQRSMCNCILPLLLGNSYDERLFAGLLWQAVQSCFALAYRSWIVIRYASIHNFLALVIGSSIVVLWLLWASHFHRVSYIHSSIITF